jgi:hypothetical protein
MGGANKTAEAQTGRISEKAQVTAEASTQMRAAEDILLDLNSRLDQTLTWDLKRQIVGTLVETARMDTIPDGKRKLARITARYRFGQNRGIANRGGTGSGRR